MVENRPLDVTLSSVDLKTLTPEQRLLRKQWQDAVASGSTKTHPYAVNRDTEAYPAGVALDVDPYEGYVPPTPGGSDPTEAIATAIAPLDTRLEVVEETLPEKVTGTQVDQKIAAKSSKFRGDWSPGELAWSDDFSAGLRSMWVANSVAAGALGGGGSRPSYGTMASGGGTLKLLVESVPALAGKTLVQTKFWHSVYRYIGGANLLTEGGVQKWARSTGADSTSPWEQEVVTLSDTGDLIWDGNGSILFLTAVEIYVAVQPYMLGEFVLYKGKMWKSKADTNGSTPGSSGTWEEVPVNFNQTYTTAGRPSASTAGKGASIYDSDLNLPLSSNGTDWTDALGTVR